MTAQQPSRESPSTSAGAALRVQTRDDLYQYLGYHAYEDKLDALFAAQK